MPSDTWGDGINDAPALRAADVGISVDKAGDVARESAVVLVLPTRRPAWRSTPGRTLLWSTVAVAAAALFVPYLGGAATVFGFVPLPAHLVGAILLIVAGYIGAIEIAKIRFFREGRSQAQGIEGISAR